MSCQCLNIGCNTLFGVCNNNYLLLHVLNHLHVFVGLWKGLGPRIIMIGTLTALQWFIYDSVKVFFRLPRPPPPEEPESLKKKRLLKQQQAA